MNFDAPTYLQDAQQHVRASLEQGVTCPCCEQLCKLYKRTIYCAMAKWLLWLVKRYEETGTWVNVKDSPVRGGDYAKLALWDLAYSEAYYLSKSESPTAGRTGMWAPTVQGIQFAKGEITVPKHAFVFNNQRFRYSDDHIDIYDALGEEFNFSEAWSSETDTVP